MLEFKSFSERLDNLTSDQFVNLALDIFQFQSVHNSVYRSYIDARGINPGNISELKDIPFLPIGFFKNKQVISGHPSNFKGYYSSSGTTGLVTSKHFFWSEEWYLHHSKRIFESEYGPLTGFHVLALLPAYLERPGSSLVSMAKFFIEQSQSEHSGFYLYNQRDLLSKLDSLRKDSRKILLLGVTFALLDFADSGLPFTKMENLLVMETGGMKGRRKEMIREEVHAQLLAYFKVDRIYSEYGMTELMSQAYSKGSGKYRIPFSMHVFLRDPNDPFCPTNRKLGGINCIDLGNFHSCSFIETQDLGSIDENGNLEVLGRFDNSELRGCNLLVQ
jgi:hypothetical protein